MCKHSKIIPSFPQNYLYIINAILKVNLLYDKTRSTENCRKFGINCNEHTSVADFKMAESRVDIASTRHRSLRPAQCRSLWPMTLRLVWQRLDANSKIAAEIRWWYRQFALHGQTSNCPNSIRRLFSQVAFAVFFFKNTLSTAIWKSKCNKIESAIEKLWRKLKIYN